MPKPGASPIPATYLVSQLALFCGLSSPGSGLLTFVQLYDCIGHGCEYSHPLQDVYIP